jgi:hypothetical protein
MAVRIIGLLARATWAGRRVGVVSPACIAYGRVTSGTARRCMGTLTHVGTDAQPAMVDIVGKPATLREATAIARVYVPPAVCDALAAPGARVRRAAAARVRGPPG